MAADHGSRLVPQAAEAVGNSRETAGGTFAIDATSTCSVASRRSSPRLERTAIGVSVITVVSTITLTLEETAHPAMPGMGALFVALAWRRVRAALRHVLGEADDD